MLITLQQAAWLAAPVVLGGLTHVAVIRLGLFGRLAERPLDGGRRVRGRRVFGDNKTLRGALVMVAATALWASLLGWAQTTLGLSDSVWVPSAVGLSPPLWGALLGLGYIVGELPNSFVKRQLDIAPGDAAEGRFRRSFWIADQVDSLGGVAVVALPVGGIPGPVLGWLVTIALVLHPLVAWLMVGLGLKERVG